MGKVDLKKELKSLYAASQKSHALVNVPAMNFLMIDGQGDPNTRQRLPKPLRRSSRWPMG
ncbi:hypothetical protein [Magnetofaba australis]|uniref:Uncharacterized protein n=1 Tax=Magnetofaba australis IT-1 TaxID=1434232 RepID=A0A1Y2K1D3_9PROT|nr:hypothetical protein [Magnetofaba australis]OSM01759.1 hypothetical protein MAIT1_01792 [Magnetofaba australis IT-1]